MLFRVLMALFALLAASRAEAQWREASTRNFIVYSAGPAADLRAFAERLEKFDYVLRRIHNVEAPPSPHRVRVFLLNSVAAVGQLAGNEGVAGFYVDDARGLMLVGTRNSRGQPIDAEQVLFHEYTHHFMYQHFPATYPTWYSEGFADFWGSTRIEGDVVEVGRPVATRLRTFSGDFNLWMPIRELLSAQSYRDVRDVALLYSMGWLLVRFTWDNAARRQQLQRYLDLVNAGAPYAEAAATSFGDLDRLNGELSGYARRGRWDYVRLPFRPIDTGPITLRTLDAAEQALIGNEMQLSCGVRAAAFPAFAAEVRATAARFSHEAYAQRMLAEVERLGGHRETAVAAVDRLLAASPGDPRGLMLKGMLEIDRLRAAGNGDTAGWDAARRLLAQAARADANDPVLFEAYYDAFAAQGNLPPEAAQAALYRAHELAPSDEGLSFKLAADFEARGMIDEAIAIIRPDAFRVPSRENETDPQRLERERREDRYRQVGTRRTESARDMLQRLIRLRQAAASPVAGAAH